MVADPNQPPAVYHLANYAARDYPSGPGIAALPDGRTPYSVPGPTRDGNHVLTVPFLGNEHVAAPMRHGLSLELSVLRRTTANRGTRIFVTCYSASAAPRPSWLTRLASRPFGEMAFTSNVNQGVTCRFRRWTITFLHRAPEGYRGNPPVRALGRLTLPERNWAQPAATMPTCLGALLISTQKEAE